MHQRFAHAATCDVARLLRARDCAHQSTSIRLSTSAAANFVQTSPCPRRDTLQLRVHMWVTLGSARKVQHLHGLTNDRVGRKFKRAQITTKESFSPRASQNRRNIGPSMPERCTRCI